MSNFLRPWAITGGIAEGKSTVLGYLRDAGLRTVSADDVARDVFSSPQTQARIVETFRTKDRAEIQRLIASDPESRRRLNALMHRPVWDAILDLRPDVIEIPLLIESVLHPHCAGVWVVTCGVEEQRRRLTGRFPHDPGRVEALLQTQLPTIVKIAFADRIIHSNLPEPHVRREVLDAVLHDFRR